MEGVAGQRRGGPAQQIKRRYVFPWEQGGKPPGEGRFCDRCAYFQDDVDGSLCLRCGRYTDNKLVEVSIIVVLALGLAVFSNYVLTGWLVRGTDTLWLRTALEYPYSVYSSPEYRHTVIFTLAGLAALPMLAGFHYGTRTGVALGCAMGFLSGVPYAGFVMPVIGAVSSLRGGRRFPAALWPMIGTVCAGGYYIFLANRLGPSDALHRKALGELLMLAGEFALLVVLIEILCVSMLRMRSWPLIPVTVFAAVGPMMLFFSGITRSAFEANFIITVYDPAKTLSAEFPEGYTAGLPKTDRQNLRPEKQLGHVLETAKYVDVMRGSAVGAANDYLKRFPMSPEAREVLFFRSDMYNARVDFSALTSAGRLETYFDRVSPEAIPTYQEINSRFPNTPYAALARYFLALEALQRGDLLDARQSLERCARDLESFVPMDFSPGEGPEPANVKELYAAVGAGKKRMNNRVFEALLETRRLRRLIDENIDYAGQPLQRLVMLDPKAEGFERTVHEIAAAYPKSRIVDNIKLMLAERIWGPAERATAMATLLEEYPESDVRDRMLYEYARALFLANLSGEGALRARPVLQELLATCPGSTYGFQAVVLLGKVNVAIATQGRAAGPPERPWSP